MKDDSWGASTFFQPATCKGNGEEVFNAFQDISGEVHLKPINPDGSIRTDL
jgi:hypothetical protein